MQGCKRWVPALLLLASCGPQPPVRTALQGDLASLKRDIQIAQQSNRLDHHLAVKLAEAVGEREVASAEGKYGALRVRTLRSCALPLRSAMEKRANAADDVAAELTLILLESHALERSALVNRYAGSDSAGFRAVAARAAVRGIDTDLRKRFFTDPDQRVRRAAFGAAYEAKDPGELEALLEAARVDPDGQAQTLAARAAGAIGGERAVLGLKDLWAQGDDARKIAIVDAWTERASFVAGGERELSVAQDSGGVAAVSAAYALVRAGGAEAGPAGAHLRHAILEGTDDEKRLALNVTPFGGDNEAAIVEASKKASAELRVVALARLSAVPERRRESLSALRELANASANSEAELRTRAAAQTALAQAGDASVSSALVKDLHSPDLQTRWHAAHALAVLGDYSPAATALADDDASLRTDVACTILARENASR
ncbi:MAG: HEAT repeat domain-containing protein [Pseudomonadota bacterium]